MSTVADYAGRTNDLLAFHGDFPGRGERLVEQSLAPPGTGGLVCTGVQKTAQKLLLVLLLKKGSMRYLPDAGTAFMIQAARGRWRTAADVSQSFYAARLDLVRQLRSAELDSDPADERVSSVDLTGITVAADSVSLGMRLTTAAGSDYTFIAPIRVGTK